MAIKFGDVMEGADALTGKSRTGWLLASCALVAMIPASVQAQDQEADTATADDAELEFSEILVTGSRLALQRALDIKRRSLSIIEVMSTDDLGKLADKNIGESINRMPGVSMTVEKGEGRFVQIRGISPSMNNVTINGMAMGSPETEGGGRRIPLDVIGGEMMGGVEVIKTRTPDMDGQGIGGSLNLITKQPFDMEKDFWVLSTVRAGVEQFTDSDDYGGHLPFGGDVTVGGKNEDHTIAWLLGGSYSSREYSARGVYQDDWREVTADDGSTLAYPEEVKNNYYIISRDRINLNGAVEFRPNESAKYFIRGFYADFDEYQHRNRFQEELDDNLTNVTENSGTSDRNRVSAGMRLEETYKSMMTLAAGGENIVGALTIDYQIQYNETELVDPYANFEFRSGSSDFGPDDFVIGPDGVVDITPGAGTLDRTDASTLGFRRVRFRNNLVNEDGIQAQLNATWQYGNDLTFKGGMKYVENNRTDDRNRTRYDEDDDFTLADGNMSYGAFENPVGSHNVANIWMDIDAMHAFFEANPDNFELNVGDTFVNDFVSDFTLSEKVMAAFGMGTYETDNLQVIAGLRVEQTKIDSTGFRVDLNTMTTSDVAASSRYTDFLPSLLVNYRPTEDLVIRAGWTRAIGRPDLGAVAPKSSFDDDNGDGSLSIGNPDLQARVAWSYDLSFEYYFNKDSLFSIAAFYKDISNEIIREPRDAITGVSAMNAALAEFDLDGVIDTSVLNELRINRNINASSSVLKGVEVSLTTQFDMLPSPFNGLGMTGSVSFIDGHNTIEGESLPLMEQPKRSTSLTLFYQKGNFDGSVTYGHNTNFVTELNDDKTPFLTEGAYGRIDAKFSYQIREGMKVFIDGVNLNNETTTEYQDDNPLWNTEIEYVGRSFFIGLSARF